METKKQNRIRSASSSSDPSEEEWMEKEDRYLVYSLGGDQYASRLIDVVEVIKAGQIKHVPHTTNHFVGIANLRGRIVSVIDLRKRFGITPKCEGYGLILVIPYEDHFFGLLVDDVLSVERFNEDEMETNFSLEAKVPIEFLVAVTSRNDRLLSIIHLEKVLHNSDLVQINQEGTIGSKAS